MKTEEDLKNVMNKLKKGNEFKNSYFDFISKLFNELGISEHSFSSKTSVTGKLELKIFIGNRDIIWLKNSGKKLLLILPVNFRPKIKSYPNAKSHDTYYKDGNGIQAYLWIEFETNLDIFNDEDLYSNWKIAVKDQILNPWGNNSISTHNTFFYKAIMNEDYRKKIIIQ